jgi:hypothetical protein
VQYAHLFGFMATSTIAAWQGRLVGASLGRMQCHQYFMPYTLAACRPNAWDRCLPVCWAIGPRSVLRGKDSPNTVLCLALLLTGANTWSGSTYGDCMCAGCLGCCADMSSMFACSLRCNAVRPCVQCVSHDMYLCLATLVHGTHIGCKLDR